MASVDKLTSMTTAAFIATLLFMLLLVSQPTTANLLSNDHSASGFTLESVYGVPEVKASEAESPDLEQSDFIKPSVLQLSSALSRQAVFELILTASDARSQFANIRAPPSLS